MSRPRSPRSAIDEADEAVVAEAIAHSDRAHLVAPAGEQGLHLGFVAPDRREVELVGAQRQLRRTFDLVLGRRREVDLQLQALDEVLEGERRPTDPGA